MNRISFAALASLTLITVLAPLTTMAPANAAVITVWPEQVTPTDANSFNVYPGWFSTPQSGGNFFAALDLPVGATVTRVTLYRATSGGSARTQVELRRTKMGAGSQVMATVNVIEEDPVVTRYFTSSIANPVVAAGYRYHLWFYLSNGPGSAQIHGAKVTYTLP